MSMAKQRKDEGYVKTGYYVGLDMGTGSLGWAVTDPDISCSRESTEKQCGVCDYLKVQQQQKNEDGCPEQREGGWISTKLADSGVAGDFLQKKFQKSILDFIFG